MITGTTTKCHLCLTSGAVVMPNWVPQWLCLSLFGLGVFLNIRPVAEIIKTFIEVAGGEAFATVLSGLVGFAGVILATLAGFRNLTKSQLETAQRERDAREHQADLKRQADLDARNHEVSVLVSALEAELSALTNRVEQGKNVFQQQADYFQHILEKDEGSEEPAILHAPKYSTPIFTANIDKLGLLGPSVAGDVVEVFAPTAISDINQEGPIPRNIAAQFARSLVTQHRKWLLEILQVRKRLLSLQGPNEDPGSLDEFRRNQNGQSSSPATAP
ncbi:hypothetical protein [Nitratireductor rhodophyticola]|uniref:hypothetical protein n=2 Tax=Nitratireductor rhodophyticola TaxID=2854036 RepID=UPI003BABD302